ncbi:hypothetical protein PV327_004484 [Microctonus hyperodae]|uniref:BBSome-interacting protein 1 n=1 Tax=Microctonus hyperodae TaxID=165561 RepID=A0AA39KMR1_MICHY|nr:hypothetical protein PV327_004484 [Microctonus hyperodae]
MSGSEKTPDDEIDIIIPQQDFLCQSESLDYILCKPKLLPLKSVTLEKLEKMQKDAEEKIKASRELEQELEKID